MSRWQEMVSESSEDGQPSASGAASAITAIPGLDVQETATLTAPPGGAQVLDADRPEAHDWSVQVPEPPARRSDPMSEVLRVVRQEGGPAGRSDTRLNDLAGRDAGDHRDRPGGAAPAAAGEPQPSGPDPAGPPLDDGWDDDVDAAYQPAELAAPTTAAPHREDPPAAAAEPVPEPAAEPTAGRPGPAVVGSGPAEHAPAATEPPAEDDDFGGIEAEPAQPATAPRKGWGRRARHGRAQDPAPDDHQAPAEADGQSAPTDDADDFGAILTITGQDQPTPRRPRPGRRALLIAALGAAAAAVLAVAALALTGGSASTPAPAAAAVTWQPFQTMMLPVSAEHGPADPAAGTGFSQTSYGAALAAAHLSSRVDPAAGPDSYGPVLASHTVGDQQRLSTAVATQYADAAAAAGITDGSPLPGTPAALTGWRTDGDPQRGRVTAHLQAGGNDYAVPLAWVDGDWRLNVPSQGDIFAVTPHTGTYQPFDPQGEQ